MKIAFPTQDGQSISAHFGRSRGFLILETQGGLITHRELRSNPQAQPVAHDHGEPGGGHGHGGHDHAGFARLLQDCGAVLAQGMGGGAVKALRAAGLRIFRAELGCTPEAALVQLAEARLAELEEGTCGCRGHHH